MSTWNDGVFDKRWFEDDEGGMDACSCIEDGKFDGWFVDNINVGSFEGSSVDSSYVGTCDGLLVILGCLYEVEIEGRYEDFEIEGTLDGLSLSINIVGLSLGWYDGICDGLYEEERNVGSIDGKLDRVFVSSSPILDG